MKPFITVYVEPEGKTLVEEHDTVDAARKRADAILDYPGRDCAEVFIFTLTHRARSERVTKFDSGTPT